MRIKNVLLTGLGFICLGMGTIGLLLPIWPTTPFVLLATACFSTSPRIRARIMKYSFFREHVENYENRNGLSRKTVFISLIWLWSMLMLSAVLLMRIWPASLLCVVGIAVTIHLVLMAKPKGVKKEKKDEACLWNV